MYWNYKACETNLPDEFKSDVVIAQVVEVLLTNNQKVDDDLSKYNNETIIREWRYRKSPGNDNHWVELDHFINGSYKLLFAVVKEPKYGDVICCLIDRKTNQLHALSVKAKSVTEIIDKYKNFNGSKGNSGWWCFRYDECEVFKYYPLHTYTEDMKMPTYLGLWSKDVVLFDNYDEANEYCTYIKLNAENKFREKQIDKFNKDLKRLGTLDNAIKKAIKEATDNWNVQNSTTQNNIALFRQLIEINNEEINKCPDWVKNV